MPQNIKVPSPSATIADGITFPVLCALMVAGRFLAKRYLGSKILIEDWLTLPALICTAGMGIALTMGVVNKGLGYPTPSESLTVVAPETVAARQAEFAIEVLQMPALTCTKLSLLLFYRRVFDTPWRKVLRFVFAFMILVCVLWGLGFFFSMTFICGSHVPAFWGSIFELRDHCPHLHTQQAWLACSDFVIDAIILLIPLPMVFRLNMTPRRKFAIWIVFLFAALTVSASITRMVIFLRAIQDLKARYALGAHDNSIITAGLYWTMFETGLGLMVVCLPSLYVLTRTMLKSRKQGEKSPCDNEIRVTVDIVMAPASGRWFDPHDSAISGCDEPRASESSGSDAEKGMEEVVVHDFAVKYA